MLKLDFTKNCVIKVVILNNCSVKCFELLASWNLQEKQYSPIIISYFRTYQDYLDNICPFNLETQKLLLETSIFTV